MVAQAEPNHPSQVEPDHPSQTPAGDGGTSPVLAAAVPGGVNAPG